MASALATVRARRSRQLSPGSGGDGQDADGSARWASLRQAPNSASPRAKPASKDDRNAARGLTLFQAGPFRAAGGRGRADDCRAGYRSCSPPTQLSANSACARKLGAADHATKERHRCRLPSGRQVTSRAPASPVQRPGARLVSLALTSGIRSLEATKKNRMAVQILGSHQVHVRRGRQLA